MLSSIKRAIHIDVSDGFATVCMKRKAMSSVKIIGNAPQM